MTKIDLSLLIILILKEKINDSYFKKYLREYLINNQKNIHLIENPNIKIKICIIYSTFLFNFFEKEEEIPENIINTFNDNAINYLLNNIFQDDKNFKQDLSDKASEAINNLFYQTINSNESLFKWDYNCLGKHFPNFILATQSIDLQFHSFYNLINNIIILIKINERDLLFECLRILTIKFEKNKYEKDNRSFLKSYFTILITFLTGVNKINPEEKDEIKKFDKIIKPIIDIIPNIGKYFLNEEIIGMFDCYMKCFNGINYITVNILKTILDMIGTEEQLNLICFNFVSTFLSKIQNNIYNDEKIDKKEIYKILIEIINKSLDLESKPVNILNSLMLIFSNIKFKY
jgi:hypothetical protein